MEPVRYGRAAFPQGAMREIALFQTHPRYHARDFERRWQTRLNTPLWRTTNNPSQLHATTSRMIAGETSNRWQIEALVGQL